MASNTDKLRKGARRFSTTLTASVNNASDTTISLASTAGLPVDTAVDVVIDRVDAAGVQTPLKEEVVTGVVSGNTLVNCIRGVEGTPQAHSPNAIVEVRLTSSQWNSQIDAFLLEHNQDGAHSAIFDKIYPVGSIYINATNSTNPSTLLGFGTWVPWAEGRAIFGFKSSDINFRPGEKTGGAKFRQILLSNLPPHRHNMLHTHSIDPPNTNTSTNGNHRHVETADYHYVPNHAGHLNLGLGDNASDNTTVYTGYAGNHYHSINIPSFTSGGSSASYTGYTGPSSSFNVMNPYQVGYIWKRTA